MNRYNHWFWNSKLMNKFAQQVTYFSTWLWGQQYKVRK